LGIASNIRGESKIGLRVETVTANGGNASTINTQLSVFDSGTKIIAGLLQNSNNDKEIFSINGDGETRIGSNVTWTKPTLYITPSFTSNAYIQGMIGIGTDNPQATLDVDGGVRISGLNNNLGVIKLVQADEDGDLSTVSAASLGGLGLWETNGTDVFRSAGNVGIGTIVPHAQLQVGDGLTSVSMGSFLTGIPAYTSNYIGFNASRDAYTTNNNNWKLVGGNNCLNGGAVIAGSLNGDLRFISIPPTSTLPIIMDDAGILNNEKLIIKSDGNVGIGNPQSYPSGYNLYVTEGILTEKLKIALTSDWMDKVFKDDYKLRSLGDLESFIIKNKHLPEIPTTAEVQNEGIDVGEIQIKLLQKVEELTLYILNLNKKIEILENAIEKGK
jgi:hypothetical protein